METGQGVADVKSPAEIFGGRLLREIEREECSLESLLKDLRTNQPLRPSKTGIPELDDLWKQHGLPKLSIYGRGLPLLYHLIYHQIRTLNGTVVLIDILGTFSPSHLSNLTREELRHIHVFRPNQANLKATMDSLEEYMLWGEGSKGSRGREWVSTLVNGGIGGDVNFGWRGWLRVERKGMGREGFGACVSVEEAVTGRERRKDEDHGEQYREVQWKAVSDFGDFTWKSSKT